MNFLVDIFLLHGPDKNVILITEGLRIKEIKEVFEGEVTELTPVETEDFVRVIFFGVMTKTWMKIQ